MSQLHKTTYVIMNLQEEYSKKSLFWLFFANFCIIVYQLYNPGKVAMISLLMQTIMYYIFYNRYKKIPLNEFEHSNFQILWIWIVILNAFRSLFFSSSNIEVLRDSLVAIANTTTLFMMFLPISHSIIRILKLHTTFAITTAFISYIIYNDYGFLDIPHLLMPFSLFVPFIPFITWKWKCYIIFICIISLFSDLSVRTNILVLGFSFFSLFSYYFFKVFFKKYVKFIHRTLFIIPFVFTFLGYTGIYNIFEDIEEQNIDINVVGSKDRVFNVDSRTAVYLEFWEAINSPKTIILGDGAVCYYEDEFHNSTGPFILPRRIVEPGILNVLKYYGIIGFLCFYMLLWSASSKAINETNNDLIRLVGLYIAFKFTLLFIEESVISIDTYLAIGLCCNKRLRQMSNYDIKNLLYNTR